MAFVVVLITEVVSKGCCLMNLRGLVIYYFFNIRVYSQLLVHLFGGFLFTTKGFAAVSTQ